MSRHHLTVSPTAEIVSRVNRHFTNCAAIAAGVALFGLSHTSDAAIVYSGPEDIALNNSFYINFETGASSAGSLASAPVGWDIVLFGGAPYGSSIAGPQQYALQGTTNIVASPTLGVTYAAKLEAGANVGSNSTFGTLKNIGFAYSGAGGYGSPAGDWIGGATGDFVGVRFETANGELYYGWVRLDVSSSGIVETVEDWAYESTLGASIITGQIASAVPEPSSAAALGVLALGAAGVQPRRRKAV